MNSRRFAARRRRVAADVAQVGEDLVVRAPVGVAQDAPRCRRSRPASGAASAMATASSAASRGRGRIGGDRQAGPLEQLDEQVDALVGRRGEPHAQVGQALADQALGRVDEQDRGLEATAAVDEVGLLPGVLEVVARVGLVGDVAGQVGGADRQVGVDVDPRAAAAVEPVVGGPRLAA